MAVGIFTDLTEVTLSTPKELDICRARRVQGRDTAVWVRSNDTWYPSLANLLTLMQMTSLQMQPPQGHKSPECGMRVKIDTHWDLSDCPKGL